MVDFSFFLGRNLNFLCSFFLDLRETSSRILKSLFTGVGHGILRLKSYHKLVLPWPYPAPQFTKQQAEHSFQNAELILSLTGLKPLNYFPLFSGQTPKSSQYLPSPHNTSQYFLSRHVSPFCASQQVSIPATHPSLASPASSVPAGILLEMLFLCQLSTSRISGFNPNVTFPERFCLKRPVSTLTHYQITSQTLLEGGIILIVCILVNSQLECQSLERENLVVVCHQTLQLQPFPKKSPPATRCQCPGSKYYHYG